MFNLVDLVVLLVLLFFVWQGYQTGLIGGLLNLLTTIISFFLASFLYPYLGTWMASFFKWSENVAVILAFFIILIFSEVILSFVANFIYKHFVVSLHYRYRGLVKIDQILGIFPSLLIGSILLSLFLLLPLVLPVNASLRSAVGESWWGRRVLDKVIAYQPNLEKYLNHLPYQNLIYLLTPSPESEELVKLSIPPETNFKIDRTDEEKMLQLVNQERASRGLGKLVSDDKLKEVARNHCLDMFKRSYFSHYTPEGKSPFDRMKEANIDYSYAGENLAYAPSVSIAHQGLMNSPGHKENILRPAFGHLGVGVIDGGFSGKMFCQEFTN